MNGASRNKMRHSVTGVGVGLRRDHYPYLLERPETQVDWFEVISENFMDTEGRPLWILESVIRPGYPVALHGVSLSIGGGGGSGGAAGAEGDESGAVDPEYLRRLRALADRIDPFLVSDHFCFCRDPSGGLHDLLPLPFTEEALARVVENIDRTQSALGRRIALENVSSYISYKESEMSEWEFISEAARRSGCGLLLDVNNVYVNAENHGFEAREFIGHISPELIFQYHLAGHRDTGSFLMDTHSAPVCDEVWELFRLAVARAPDAPVLIEWDEHIPDFPRLEAEAEKARACL